MEAQALGEKKPHVEAQAVVAQQITQAADKDVRLVQAERWADVEGPEDAGFCVAVRGERAFGPAGRRSFFESTALLGEVDYLLGCK